MVFLDAQIFAWLSQQPLDIVPFSLGPMAWEARNTRPLPLDPSFTWCPEVPLSFCLFSGGIWFGGHYLWYPTAGQLFRPELSYHGMKGRPPPHDFCIAAFCLTVVWILISRIKLFKFNTVIWLSPGCNVIEYQLHQFKLDDNVVYADFAAQDYMH